MAEIRPRLRSGRDLEARAALCERAGTPGTGRLLGHGGDALVPARHGDSSGVRGATQLWQE